MTAKANKRPEEPGSAGSTVVKLWIRGLGLVLGGLLFLLSIIVPWRLGSAPALDERDRVRLVELEARLADLEEQIREIKARTGSGLSAREGSVAFRNSQDERDALLEKQRRGSEYPERVGALLRWSAAAVLAVGVAAHLMLSTPPQPPGANRDS